jgi:hypothetical protein
MREPVMSLSSACSGTAQIKAVVTDSFVRRVDGIGRMVRCDFLDDETRGDASLCLVEIIGQGIIGFTLGLPVVQSAAQTVSTAGRQQLKHDRCLGAGIVPVFSLFPTEL